MRCLSPAPGDFFSQFSGSVSPSSCSPNTKSLIFCPIDKSSLIASVGPGLEIKGPFREGACHLAGFPPWSGSQETLPVRGLGSAWISGQYQSLSPRGEGLGVGDTIGGNPCHVFLEHIGEKSKRVILSRDYFARFLSQEVVRALYVHIRSHTCRNSCITYKDRMNERQASENNVEKV